MQAQEDENNNVTIMWACLPYYCFHREDRFKKNLGIALLESLGVAQKDIQRLFKVGRNTITRIASLYGTKGPDGLIGYQQGPKPLEKEIQDFVIARYKELEGARGYQNTILEAVRAKCQKGEFARPISRQTLYTIIKDYRQERERLLKENEQKERRKEEQSKKAEEQKREEELRARQQPELPTDGAQSVVECGGSVVTAVFVNEFKTMDRIPEGFAGDETEERFTNREMAFAYVALNAAKVVTVEQDFKSLPSYLMGGILGRGKLPSLSLYRSRIPKVIEQIDIEEVIRQTAKQMSEVFPFSRVVYVDGHFLPYYGGSALLGGYSSQRRLVMAGREYFWVHDENGIPVYATISDGYRRMRFYLKRLDGDLRWIYGAKRRELLVVFDRGGYSKAFCVGVANTMRFICWRSDARIVPKDAEWQKVKVEREGNAWGEKNQEVLYAWERKAVFEVGRKKREFREVWIREGKKVSPALTNDGELSLEEVVSKLVRRWGAQENGFKKLKDHGIDRIHSYGKEPYSEEYLYESGLEDREEGVRREVDNPIIKELDKEIARVKRKIARQKEALEKAEKKGKKAALVKVKGKLRYWMRRLDQLMAKKGEQSKKVLLYQIIQEKGIERIRKEKKLFFDWLKMHAMWSRNRIAQIVKPYYQDLRDVEKFVDSILRSRTYVRISKDVMYVEFPNQHSEQKQEALEHLCEELNRCDSIDIGLNSKKLFFSVR